MFWLVLSPDKNLLTPVRLGEVVMKTFCKTKGVPVTKERINEIIGLLDPYLKNKLVPFWYNNSIDHEFA